MCASVVVIDNVFNHIRKTEVDCGIIFQAGTLCNLVFLTSLCFLDS